MLEDVYEDFLFEYNHNEVLEKPSRELGTIFFDKQRGNYMAKNHGNGC
jgi:hypothetical protein